MANHRGNRNEIMLPTHGNPNTLKQDNVTNFHEDGDDHGYNESIESFNYSSIFDLFFFVVFLKSLWNLSFSGNFSNTNTDNNNNITKNNSNNKNSINCDENDDCIIDHIHNSNDNNNDSANCVTQHQTPQMQQTEQIQSKTTHSATFEKDLCKMIGSIDDTSFPMSGTHHTHNSNGSNGNNLSLNLLEESCQSYSELSHTSSSDSFALLPVAPPSSTASILSSMMFDDATIEAAMDVTMDVTMDATIDNIKICDDASAAIANNTQVSLDLGIITPTMGMISRTPVISLTPTAVTIITEEREDEKEDSLVNSNNNFNIDLVTQSPELKNFTEMETVSEIRTMPAMPAMPAIPAMIGVNLEMYDSDNSVYKHNYLSTITSSDNGEYNSDFFDDYNSCSGDDDSVNLIKYEKFENNENEEDCTQDQDSEIEFPDIPNHFDYTSKGSEWSPKWHKNRQIGSQKEWETWISSTFDVSISDCESDNESDMLIKEYDSDTNENDNESESENENGNEMDMGYNGFSSQSATPTYNRKYFLELFQV